MMQQSKQATHGEKTTVNHTGFWEGIAYKIGTLVLAILLLLFIRAGVFQTNGNGSVTFNFGRAIDVALKLAEAVSEITEAPPTGGRLE